MTAPHPDARFWNRFARRYEKMRIRDSAGYERSLARMVHYLQDKPEVVEIGCGTGTIALRLAPHVRHLLATDISSEMIAIAREKAAAQNCRNVDFVVTDAEHLPVAPGSCDAVVAVAVLHLLPDRHAALRNLHRLLKPGGFLITKTPCTAELQLRYRLLVPILRTIGLAPRLAKLSAQELAQDIAAAGFEVVETARHGSGPRDVRLFLVARRT